MGSDPASAIYVRNKINAARKVGIDTELNNFEENISEKILLSEILRMNLDSSISGIIVQLPLPKQISKEKVINAIDPAKDVDGFHPFNVGIFKIAAIVVGLYHVRQEGVLSSLNLPRLT